MLCIQHPARMTTVQGDNACTCCAQVFFTPLSQALRLIIHLGEPLPEDRLNEFTFDFGTLSLFFLLPYALMMWTNGVGASTGMFVPALAVGATGARPCVLKGLLPPAPAAGVAVPVTWGLLLACGIV